MIRTDQEYNITMDRIREMANSIQTEREEMIRDGFSPDEVKRGLAPLISFRQSLQDLLDHYDQIRNGWLPEVRSLNQIGYLLIALRIQRRWTQKDLADRLGVAPSQVCRDEKNDYYGITCERASKILDVFNVRLSVRVQPIGTTVQQGIHRTDQYGAGLLGNERAFASFSAPVQVVSQPFKPELVAA